MRMLATMGYATPHQERFCVLNPEGEVVCCTTAKTQFHAIRGAVWFLGRSWDKLDALGYTVAQAAVCVVGGPVHAPENT